MKIERIQDIESYAVSIKFNKAISCEKAAIIIAKYEKRLNKKDTYKIKGPFKGAIKSTCYHIGDVWCKWSSFRSVNIIVHTSSITAKVSRAPLDNKVSTASISFYTVNTIKVYVV